MLTIELRRRVVAEALGTGLLVAVVIGSGIMAARLAPGTPALALLANAVATGAGLYAILVALAPISGAHLNPAVSLAMAWRRELPRREVGAYVAAQLVGGALGAVVANAMFALPWIAVATQARTGSALMLSEGVATFGLLAVIWATARRRPGALPGAVAMYITAAYWFTASTSFANPAVTVARTLSDSFAGIRPADVPGFIAAQLVGATLATALMAYLVPASPAEGSRS
ncbi:MAG: MIP/aquaporin family protein [Kofleriaceae bacterium]